MATTPDGTPFVEPGDSIAAYPTVSQELAAVIDSLRTMIPVGAVFPYAGKTAPEGYLFCDGKAYTRTDFYDLYQVMADWVGEWGGFPGGNSAQFFVPDFRGRSPMGASAIGNEDYGPNGEATHPIGLGKRYGDKRVGDHAHQLVAANNAQIYADSGSVTGSGNIQQITVGARGNATPNTATNNAFTATSATRRGMYPPDDGLGNEIYTNTNLSGGMSHGRAGNIPPVTAVNFIVWTGTTTTGKNPVPGVELPPVTTRMMIEARLEEAGIGEEEIEMLREQLAALKEDTNG